MQENRIIRKQKTGNGLAGFWDTVFLDQKLNNWIGYVLGAGIAIVFGVLMSRETLAGFGLFGLVIGFFVVLACIANTELGLYINVVYSFFAFHISRWLFNDEFPVGVVTDILILATMLSLFIRG